MKNQDFLNDLYLESKIQLVEPSEELKKAYFSRSDESLSSAKALLGVGNLNDAVALVYYAMYHALLALLFRVGIKCENHAAAIMILKEVFGLDNTEISRAKKERIDRQYYVDFGVTQEEVGEAITIAEEFRSRIRDFVEKMSGEDARKYRERFERAVKEGIE